MSFWEDLNKLKKECEPIEQNPIDVDYDDNLFNLGDTSAEQKEKLDSIVYRVMKLDHFFKWCYEGMNVLPSVDKWDDPWERALFKNPVIYNGTESIDVSNFIFYGQCWSFEKKDSDATWRIFKATDGGCIRIGIRARDLYESLKKYVGKTASISCYAGKVQYLKDYEIHSFFQNKPFSERLTASGIDLAETLFVKRESFLHENEFRILYFPTAGGNICMPKPSNGLFKYDLLVDKIQYVKLGPEISHSVIEKNLVEIKHKRIEKMLRSVGVACDIERSDIYDFPLLNISY